MPLPDLESRYLHPGPPVHRGDTEPTAIVDGADFLGAIERAMQAAAGPGDRILILGWRFTPDMDLLGRPPEDSAREPLGDLLARKAAAGVDVRLVLDGHLVFSNFPPPGLGFLRSAAGFRDNALAAYRLRRWPAPAAPRGPEHGRTGPLARSVLLDWSGAILGSHHQKMTLVTARGESVAFVSGIDFWPNRLDAPPHDRLRDKKGGRSGWHDVGIALRGPAARDMWRAFESRWREAATLPGRTWFRFWVRPPGGLVPLEEPFITATDPLDPAPPPAPPPAPEIPSRQSVQVLRSRFPYKVRIPPIRWKEPPTGGLHEVFETLRHAIGGARRYIYVEDQFLGDNPFRKPKYSVFPYLRDAADRGVKLILVTSGKSRPQAPSSNDINYGLNNDIERYIVKKLPEAKRENVVVYRVAHLTVHSKVLLADDAFAAVGTANLQSRSMDGQDFELHVALVDEGTWVRDLRVRLWAEHLRLALDEGPAAAAGARRRNGGAVRAALENLDLALGIWRSQWLPPRVPPETWRTPDVPPGYRPREAVLNIVGPIFLE